LIADALLRVGLPLSAISRNYLKLRSWTLIIYRLNVSWFPVINVIVLVESTVIKVQNTFTKRQMSQTN